jgi:hypothetical protein
MAAAWGSRWTPIPVVSLTPVLPIIDFDGRGKKKEKKRKEKKKKIWISLVFHAIPAAPGSVIQKRKEDSLLKIITK